MLSQINKEKTKKNINLILDRIRTEADPQLLNEYRSLFKGEISLFRRSWASAYLLMLFDQGALGRPDKNKNRKNGEERPRSGGYDAAKKQARDGEPRAEPQRYPLAEEESRRLFISVGRNRRVFPREILGLINTKTAIPKEDIGAIRILDNYSFVQVRDTVADQIIEALNGMNFRGRTLAVNYAKSRKDEAAETGEDGGQNPADNEIETDAAVQETAFASDETGYPPETDGDTAGYPETDAGLSEQNQDHPDEKDI
jgi:hypothetical protein